MKLEELRKVHKFLYNEEPNMCLFTPGRVNLIGEHIDYNGGLVLPFAITKGTYALVSKRSDKLFACYSQNFKDLGAITFDPKSIEKDNNWVDFVKGMYLEVLKEKSIDFGLNLTIYGTIPTSSGLSSSASLEVLIGNIFKSFYNLDINDEQIALAGQACEHHFIGVNCGIMDQYIISCAKDDSVMLLNCANLDHDYASFDLGNYKILVMNTCKKRDLAASKYNERLDECHNTLNIIKNYYDINDLCSLNVFDLVKIKDIFNGSILYNRALHCATEMARVKDCFNALAINDLEMVGKLLNASHKSLKEDYEVSCKELDTLVSAAQELDYCLGARMTGAGFGGCAIAIVDKEHVADAIKYISEKYQKECILTCEIYVASVAGNTKQISLKELDYEL